MKTDMIIVNCINKVVFWSFSKPLKCYLHYFHCKEISANSIIPNCYCQCYDKFAQSMIAFKCQKDNFK